MSVDIQSDNRGCEDTSARYAAEVARLTADLATLRAAAREWVEALVGEGEMRPRETDTFDVGYQKGMIDGHEEGFKKASVIAAKHALEWNAERSQLQADLATLKAAAREYRNAVGWARDNNWPHAELDRYYRALKDLVALVGEGEG